MRFFAEGSQVLWTPGSEGVRYAILNNVVYNSTTGEYTVKWVQALYGTLIYGGGGTITTFEYIPAFDVDTYILVQLKKFC